MIVFATLDTGPANISGDIIADVHPDKHINRTARFPSQALIAVNATIKALLSFPFPSTFL
jgi:hypothetical protein